MLDHSIVDPSELLEMLGFDSAPYADYGARGRDVSTRSEIQVKAVEKLSAKFGSPVQTKDDGEIDEYFDILSKPRVILFESNVQKRSLTSSISSSFEF